MNYDFSKDLMSIREILGVSQQELANFIGVEQTTISRSESGVTNPSYKLLEKVYGFAFEKNIRINKLKEMLWKEQLGAHQKLLFHGAKSAIDGVIDIHKGRPNNDFGTGFYTGESYDQSVSFVSGFSDSSVYYLRFDDSNLKCKKYTVNQEWMLTIAFYRGRLGSYEHHPLVESIVSQSKNCDYIIAPIADNRMFQIINSFIDGEITDEQCKHCLAATNLGNQYVFTSDVATSRLVILERVYVSDREREYYKTIRSQETKLGGDKVKLARREFRGQGKYIDEILV